MFIHQNQIFRKTIFRPLGSDAPQIFTRARESPRLTSAPPHRGRESLLQLFHRGEKLA